MRTLPDPLPRRTVLGLFAAGVFALRAKPQKGKRTMVPASTRDDERLQRYYDIQAKYHPDPVPAPLDRATAIAFVNARASRDTPLDKMRKLVRLAVFYNLQETAAAFNSALTGGERQPADVTRSALALVALAWIAPQSRYQEYYHSLQDRANIDLHREIMLEVVEAFGPREGTGYHRQWIQGAIRSLESHLKQEQADQNIPAAKLSQEKINALTEYLNLQLARVDRTFAIRQRTEAAAPSTQIAPLVALSLATIPEATPQLSYWASMQLLRLASTSRDRIAAEFLSQATARLGQDLVRARALRAAEFLGQVLPESDRQWLAGQPDTGTDPLVLRP